jgi:hypothetical protein
MDYKSHWGPYYWYFLHSIAYNYPLHPNEITKCKYYELIHNMPLFIPDIDMANNFQQLLHDYPLSPYLNNRSDLTIWMHHIHNVINKQLHKKCISYYESFDLFNENYHIIKDKTSVTIKKKQVLYHTLFIFLCICILSCFIVVSACNISIAQIIQTVHTIINVVSYKIHNCIKYTSHYSRQFYHLCTR